MLRDRAQVTAAREMRLKQLEAFLRDDPLGCGELYRVDTPAAYDRYCLKNYDK